MSERAWYYGEVATWRGASGRSYRFSVYDLYAPTLALDGVYILAGPGDILRPWEPILIASAEDFDATLAEDAGRLAAIERGASSLHIYYTNTTHPDRHEVCRDLVLRHRPVLEAAQPDPVPGGAQIIPFPRRRA